MSGKSSVLVVGEVVADLVVVGDRRHHLGQPVSSPLSNPALHILPGSSEAGSPASSEILHLVARAGGSPANVAIGLARLRVAVQFAGRLSSSGLGPWLSSHLVANGVDVSASVPAAEPPTLALVALDAEGLATYGFYGWDTADWQWRADELPSMDRLTIAAVHTGSLATTIAPGAEALFSWARAVRASQRVLISYDPNARPSCVSDVGKFAKSVGSWLTLAHLVKVSEQDLAFLYPGTDAVKAARCWALAGPEIVVLTRGAREVIAFRPDGSSVVGPPPAGAVVDTVGAGDAFSAGLLAWLAEAGSLHPGGLAALSTDALFRSLDVATRVASLTCGRQGADPPRRSELAGAPWVEGCEHQQRSSAVTGDVTEGGSA